MNFSIERIETEMQYLDYVRSWSGRVDQDTGEVLDRYADNRNISEAQRLAIEQLARFIRPQPQPTMVNINNFHGCQVTIHSIGSIWQ